MQPVSPYRFSGRLGHCQVGSVWSAVDEQGRPVTVAVLDAAAGDQRWRAAFAQTVNALAQPGPDRPQYVRAEVSAEVPWAAYAGDGATGVGAERVFETLGMQVLAADPAETPTTTFATPSGAWPTVPQQAWGSPVSGPPTSSAPHSPAVPDDYGLVFPPSQDPFSSSGRRIAPSEPRRRRTGPFLTGLLAGLLAGLVILAPAGYFVGDLMFGDGSTPAATGEPGPPSTALPPYEARQAEVNRAKFNGDLAALAEPWLPYLSRCVANSDPGAPRAPKSEVTRVTCQLGNMTVFFVQFKTTEDRNQEFLVRKQQNADAQQSAPGAAAPSRTAEVPGNYVEYAFRHSAPGAQTFAGIWWDRDDAPLVAARVEVLWDKGLNQRWEPLRDIWQRQG